MSVYVDDARNAFGRMIMGHLIADTPEELHSMAVKCGMRRAWFQGMASFPHYDVSRSRRKLALIAGAIAVDRRELAAHMKRIRSEGVWRPEVGGWV